MLRPYFCFCALAQIQTMRLSLAMVDMKTNARQSFTLHKTYTSNLSQGFLWQNCNMARLHWRQTTVLSCSAPAGDLLTLATDIMMSAGKWRNYPWAFFFELVPWENVTLHWVAQYHVYVSFGLYQHAGSTYWVLPALLDLFIFIYF